MTQISPKCKQLTPTEKSARISQLEYKCCNVGMQASFLLEIELENRGLDHDPKFTAAVQQLKKMEKHLGTLRQQYDIRANNELKPLVRGFEQQREQLLRQQLKELNNVLYEAYPTHQLRMQQVMQKQQAELRTLRQNQIEQTAALRKKLNADIDAYKQTISATFMQFVHQIYK